MKQIKAFILVLAFILLNNPNLKADVPYYLDFKLILNQSEAGKKAQNILKKKLDNGLASISKREKSLQDEEKKIISQKKIISAEEYKKKVTELRGKVGKLQKDRNNLLKDISTQRSKARNELLRNLNPIIKEYMIEKKIRYVMDKKSLIRKKYFLKRKKKFFEISDKFFLPLINLIKKRGISKKAFISLYYPSSFELDVLKILKVEYFKKFNFLLPIIQKNKSMEFYKWKHNEILYVNKYGIPEPTSDQIVYPSILLVPLVAFDNHLNRIGYGGGYYDRYITKLKKNKKIILIGLAYSFQKVKKIPANKYDMKLDFIVTDKNFI